MRLVKSSTSKMGLAAYGLLVVVLVACAGTVSLYFGSGMFADVPLFAVRGAPSKPSFGMFQKAEHLFTCFNYTSATCGGRLTIFQHRHGPAGSYPRCRSGLQC